MTKKKCAPKPNWKWKVTPKNPKDSAAADLTQILVNEDQISQNVIESMLGVTATTYSAYDSRENYTKMRVEIAELREMVENANR